MCKNILFMKVTSIKEIINSPVSNWSGSETTRSMIEDQIRERWGETELKNYDPLHTARTFQGWLNLGYRIKKGERALKSIVFIESKDDKGNIIKKMKRPCNIFYYRQVELNKPQENL